MAGFAKGIWTVLFGEVVAAAAVLAMSPKAREAARPYLVRGIRSALDLKDEFGGMVDEAKHEAERLVEQIEADRLGTTAPRAAESDYAGAGTRAAR
jgi:hypothetical protein